jgi:cytochrome c
MNLRFAVIPALGAVALISFALSNASTVRAHDDAAKPEFYTTKVKPIFDANCARCHGGTFHRGGLNIDTRESLLKGGHDGTVVVPGDPASSLLIKLIRHEGPTDDPGPMPPNKPKISDDDIAIVTQWIKAGAVMPQ